MGIDFFGGGPSEEEELAFAEKKTFFFISVPRPPKSQAGVSGARGLSNSLHGGGGFFAWNFFLLFLREREATREGLDRVWFGREGCLEPVLGVL